MTFEIPDYLLPLIVAAAEQEGITVEELVIRVLREKFPPIAEEIAPESAAFTNSRSK